VYVHKERNSIYAPKFSHLMLQNPNTFKAIRIRLWQILCAYVTGNKSFLSNYVAEQWNIVGYTYITSHNELLSTFCTLHICSVFYTTKSTGFSC